MKPTALIDTSVFIHATGFERPLRDGCAAVLAAAADGLFEPAVSVETIQEIVHVWARRTDDRAGAVALARGITEVVELTPVTAADMPLALDLAELHESLSGRDALIAAGALNRSIKTVISVVRAFDEIPGIGWVDPGDAIAVEEFLSHAK